MSIDVQKPSNSQDAPANNPKELNKGIGSNPFSSAEQDATALIDKLTEASKTPTQREYEAARQEMKNRDQYSDQRLEEIAKSKKVPAHIRVAAKNELTARTAE